VNNRAVYYPQCIDNFLIWQEVICCAIRALTHFEASSIHSSRRQAVRIRDAEQFLSGQYSTVGEGAWARLSLVLTSLEIATALHNILVRAKRPHRQQPIGSDRRHADPPQFANPSTNRQHSHAVSGGRPMRENFTSHRSPTVASPSPREIVTLVEDVTPRLRRLLEALESPLTSASTG